MRVEHTLALMLAVLLQPSVLQAQSAGSPTCSPPPAAQPLPDPDPSLVLGAGAALGVLNLPSIAIGPSVLAEIDAGWPIDLELSYFPANAAEVADHDLDLGLHPLFFVPFPAGGSQLKMSLLQANAGVCPLRHRLESGSLLACGGIYGGILHGKAEGFVDQNSESRLLLGAEVYARWHFRLAGPLGLSYSAGLFVPFMRDRFGYLDRKAAFRTLYREPALGGRLDVALDFWFR